MNQLQLEKIDYFNNNDNKYSVGNLNNSHLILKEVSYKIKAFHFPISGDYFQEPIAKIILKKFFDINDTGFIYMDPNGKNEKYFSLSSKQTANFITLFAIIICIPSIWYLATNNSKKRYYSIIAFQIKNIFDYIDGPIIRKNAQISPQKQIDYGRFLDGMGNGIPTVFFIIGSYIFILRSLHLARFSLSSEIYNQLNFYYKLLYKVSNYISKKFQIFNFSSYSKLSIDDKNFENDLIPTRISLNFIREVYFNLTIFVIYFFTSGILWNLNLDKYRDTFSTLNISSNGKKELYMMSNFHFVDLMLLRNSCALFIQDVYCVFICLNRDWVS
ncbi:unnamed protein product [Brachionus calyciflorus]|uniref:Uncharacterized protein n=1 Tax=Brachionus calyciflorus TaxID=104777 RepID=A0A813MU05_9BILA|nr:unnamed protein product [Brachionus calyciflorus]